MRRILTLFFIFCITQRIHAGATSSKTTSLHQVTQSQYQMTNTTPPPDKPIRHGLNLYYHKGSLEHLLLVHSFNDCFVMPLNEKDVQDILNPQKLRLMEEHMMDQIGHHNFITWTYDDYELRDKGWSDGCKKRNGTIYRVFRL